MAPNIQTTFLRYPFQRELSIYVIAFKCQCKTNNYEYMWKYIWGSRDYRAIDEQPVTDTLRISQHFAVVGKL